MSYQHRLPKDMQGLTVARAALACKVHRVGGFDETRTDFCRSAGVTVEPSTWAAWVVGIKIPDGNAPSYDGGVPMPPLRHAVTRWLGLTDDRWWFTPLAAEHINEEGDAPGKVSRLVEEVDALPAALRCPAVEP